jgi:hypothetical protein
MPCGALERCSSVARLRDEVRTWTTRRGTPKRHLQLSEVPGYLRSHLSLPCLTSTSTGQACRSSYSHEPCRSSYSHHVGPVIRMNGPRHRPEFNAAELLPKSVSHACGMGACTSHSGERRGEEDKALLHRSPTSPI